MSRSGKSRYVLSSLGKKQNKRAGSAGIGNGCRTPSKSKNRICFTLTIPITEDS
jgi:hypothetical protein